MFADITIGRYFPGDSPLHRLDSRVKIILLILLMFAVFLCADAPSYALLTVLSLALALLGGVSIKTLFGAVKPLWVILLITFAVHLFGTEGETLFAVGELNATIDGAKNGLFMCLRLVLLIIFSSLLVFTTDPLELTDAAEALLSPFTAIGLPAHELAMMMSIALRFVPTLLDETDKIMKAQTARGAQFSSGSLITRLKNFVPILVPLFISCFRRADELALAMDARCYPVGGEGRTHLRQMKIAALEYEATAFILGIVVVLVGFRIYL